MIARIQKKNLVIGLFLFTHARTPLRFWAYKIHIGRGRDLLIVLDFFLST